jgi:hypothetical protein
MKNVIYKYSVVNRGVSNLMVLPAKAKILTIQTQGDTINLWAQVNPEVQETEVRFIKRLGTGQEFELHQEHTYISTVQEGPYVWHYFEVL